MTEREKNNLVGVLYCIDRYDIAVNSNIKTLRSLVSETDFCGDNKSQVEVINSVNNIVEAVKLIRHESDNIHEVLGEVNLEDDNEKS